MQRDVVCTGALAMLASQGKWFGRQWDFQGVNDAGFFRCSSVWVFFEFEFVLILYWGWVFLIWWGFFFLLSHLWLNIKTINSKDLQCNWQRPITEVAETTSCFSSYMTWDENNLQGARNDWSVTVSVSTGQWMWCTNSGRFVAANLALKGHLGFCWVAVWLLAHRLTPLVIKMFPAFAKWCYDNHHLDGYIRCWSADMEY